MNVKNIYLTMKKLFEEGKIDLEDFKHIVTILFSKRLDDLREQCMELYRQGKLTDDERSEKMLEANRAVNAEFKDINKEMDILLGYMKEE